MDYNYFYQLLILSKNLKKFLGNPLITKEAKKNVVKDILGEQIDGSTLKFLLLLVDRNRIEVLDSIAESFNPWDFAEIIFLSKYIGDYNITKYGSKLTLENAGKILVVERIQ